MGHLLLDPASGTNDQPDMADRSIAAEDTAKVVMDCPATSYMYLDAQEEDAVLVND